MKTVFHAYRKPSLKPHRFLKVKGGPYQETCVTKIINCLVGGYYSLYPTHLPTHTHALAIASNFEENGFIDEQMDELKMAQSINLVAMELQLQSESDQLNGTNRRRISFDFHTFVCLYAWIRSVLRRGFVWDAKIEAVVENLLSFRPFFTFYFLALAIIIYEEEKVSPCNPVVTSN